MVHHRKKKRKFFSSIRFIFFLSGIIALILPAIISAQTSKKRINIRRMAKTRIITTGKLIYFGSSTKISGKFKAGQSVGEMSLKGERMGKAKKKFRTMIITTKMLTFTGLSPQMGISYTRPLRNGIKNSYMVKKLSDPGGQNE